MQNVLGSIPIEFTRYWVKRFPHFISHNYHALEQCAQETIFKPYYNENYQFEKPDYFYQITEDFVPQEREPKTVKESNRYNNKTPNDKRNEDGTGKSNENSPISNNNRPNRKGMYNFHRNNFNNDSELTETTNTNTTNNNNGGLTHRKFLFKKRKENSNVRWTLPTEHN